MTITYPTSNKSSNINTCSGLSFFRWSIFYYFIYSKTTFVIEKMYPEIKPGMKWSAIKAA